MCSPSKMQLDSYSNSEPRNLKPRLGLEGGVKVSLKGFGIPFGGWYESGL